MMLNKILGMAQQQMRDPKRREQAQRLFSQAKTKLAARRGAQQQPPRAGA